MEVAICRMGSKLPLDIVEVEDGSTTEYDDDWKIVTHEGRPQLLTRRFNRPVIQFYCYRLKEE